MPFFTEIKRAKRGSVDIFIDGCFWRNVSSQALLELGIVKGREVTDEELALLGEEVEIKEALNVAYVFLAHRARSSSEVRRRLIKAGHGEKAISSVVDRLTEIGYVDDFSFANQWISSRAQVKQLGSRRLKSELKSMGVADELIAENIEIFCDDEAEEKRAISLAKSRLEKMRELPENVVKRRLMNALIYRGFTPNVAKLATEQAVKEQVNTAT